MTSHRCENCNRDFSSADALAMHNRSKHYETVSKPLINSKQKKKLKKLIWIIIIIGLIYGSFSLFSSDAKTLPPTTMQGHIEVNPPSHIMKNPMRIEVHKHMLEHADAVQGGRGGVIINYNCNDYQCQNSLVDKIEAFATKYPKHVYVAPFKNMDAKIVLTKLNQQKILEEYDENVIDGFVR